MLKFILNPHIISVIMLVCSNCFMTFAWYAHLKNMSHRAWYIAAISSWMIAFCEYMIMVPANRIGYQVYSLPQLKIIQEVVTLSVFIPFSMYYMNQPFKLDYLWSGVCLMGAVYFMFRSWRGYLLFSNSPFTIYLCKL